MLVRPMLLHRMALVSVRLFCKNLGNLQEFFGQMVYRPPWQKIARTPSLCIKGCIILYIVRIFSSSELSGTPYESFESSLSSSVE